jgi:hypothetical protein
MRKLVIATMMIVTGIVSAGEISIQLTGDMIQSIESTISPKDGKCRKTARGEWNAYRVTVPHVILVPLNSGVELRFITSGFDLGNGYTNPNKIYGICGEAIQNANEWGRTKMLRLTAIKGGIQEVSKDVCKQTVMDVIYNSETFAVSTYKMRQIRTRCY